MKSPYIKKKSGVRVVVDYADTRFSKYAMEYLCENEKNRETVFACSNRSNMLSQKNCRKSRDTVPLMHRRIAIEKKRPAMCCRSRLVSTPKCQQPRKSSISLIAKPSKPPGASPRVFSMVCRDSNRNLM